MSSFVYYKFGASRGEHRVSFEGTGISVYDLKRDILQQNKITKGNDFDIHIYNSDTHEEYKEDRAIVPRSTSVMARRLPAARPGQGTAAHYIEQSANTSTSQSTLATQGKDGAAGSLTGTADPRSWLTGGSTKSKEEKSVPSALPGLSTSSTSGTTADEQLKSVVMSSAVEQDEASALANVMAQASQQWEDIQTQMESAPRAGGKGGPVPAYRTTVGPNGRPAAAGANAAKFIPQPLSEQTKPPPPGYICFRCGQKGHWIQFCPTNFDPDFDNKPRFKRTTGIPKSFLTTVDASEAEKVGAGIMMTADGGYVIANPDRASWEAHRAIRKNLTPEDVQNLPPRDPDLTCPVCSKLLRDAILSPCCETSFCETCFISFLNENDNMCPECDSFVRTTKFKPDDQRRVKVKEYIDMIVQESHDESVESKKLSKKERKAQRRREKEEAVAAAAAQSEVSAPNVDPKQEAFASAAAEAAGEVAESNNDVADAFGSRAMSNQDNGRDLKLGNCNDSDSDSTDSSDSESDDELDEHFDDLSFLKVQKRRQRIQAKPHHRSKAARLRESVANDAIAFLLKMEEAQNAMYQQMEGQYSQYGNAYGNGYNSSFTPNYGYGTGYPSASTSGNRYPIQQQQQQQQSYINAQQWRS